MGIENITARILQEAKDEAKKTQEAAAAQKAAMLEKAAQDAAAAEAKMAEKATEDAKVLLERRNSVAELEARSFAWLPSRRHWRRLSRRLPRRSQHWTAVFILISS